MNRTSCGSIFATADVFGVSLNGKPAALDVAPVSGLARVRTLDRTNTAHFNWSVAARVVKEQKGNFVSRDNLDGRGDFANPVMATLAILRG